MQQFVDLQRDPVEQVDYLFRQAPGVSHQGIAESEEAVLAPQVQPEERHRYQPEQAADAPPTTYQEQLQVKTLLDAPRGVFDPPTATIGFDEPLGAATATSCLGTDQQHQRC